MADKKSKKSNPAPEHAPNNSSQSVRKDPVNQLEQIKDIIFGPEMKTMNTSLQDLQDALKKQQEAFDVALESLRADVFAAIDGQDQRLTKKIEQAESEIGKELDRLETAKSDRQEVGKLLIQIGEELLKEKE